MAEEATLKVTFIRTETEDPRPWAEFVRIHRKVGSVCPEHGPWETEPDRAEWIDQSTGWPCLVRRGPAGNWCGYVCVPRSHPFHGHGYHELEWDEERQDSLVYVHGGLTFADQMLDEGDWWFGFDCSHAGDLVPGMPTYGLTGDVYRNLEYAVMNVSVLALQLKALV